jgi:hypothetical protein
MKIVKYLSTLFAIALIFSSCKKEIEFEMDYLTDQAQFQIHYMVPVTSGATTEALTRIDINGQNVTNGQYSIATYNAQPSTYSGLYYVGKAGTNNIKLYKKVDGADVEVYNRDIALKSGQQNVVIYDFNQDPLIYTLDLPSHLDDLSYDTDTIGYIKFYNLMFETPGVPNTTVKLQYQYRYTLHPIYTMEDDWKGLIPEGKKIGDATGDATKSKWANLGQPVGFGETTGWVRIPVKKTGYIVSAAGSGSGRPTIEYRMLVEGGTVDVEKNADGILRYCATGKETYSFYGTIGDTGATSERGDYWSLGIGNCVHHFFAGARAGLPGSAVRSFTAW